MINSIVLICVTEAIVLSIPICVIWKKFKNVNSIKLICDMRTNIYVLNDLFVAMFTPAEMNNAKVYENAASPINRQHTH